MTTEQIDCDMQLLVMRCVAVDVISQYKTGQVDQTLLARIAIFLFSLTNTKILKLISCAASPDAAQGPQNITRKYSLERAKSESS